MLLLQSDMLKAIWFMIFPIVELFHGITPSDSTFCQVSGFFLTVGTEACDVAVVLIALHTALFIFLKGSGLYPYRRWAYAAFIGLPLMLASVAFVNTPAFANSGEFCYLPSDPNWARQSLSWIPRYVIFVTLIFTYAFVYGYVAILMKKYGALAGTRRGSRALTMRPRTGSVPPLPRISTHGLISARSSRHPSAASSSRQNSVFSTFLVGTRSRRASLTSAILISAPKKPGPTVKWNMPQFGLDAANSFNTEESNIVLDTTVHTLAAQGEEASPVSPTNPHALEQSSATSDSPVPDPQADTIPVAPAVCRSFWHRSFAVAMRQSRAHSVAHILTILRRGPRTSSSYTTSSVFLSPTALAATGMVEMRENIRRQTRYLFIYPLVYMVVWLAPFASHLMGGDNEGAPFGVLLASLLSLCIQGTADAIIFSLREKPWNQSLPDAKVPQLCFWDLDREHDQRTPNIGRTRQEMLIDSEIAKRRLDEELAEKRMERLALHRPAANWWDFEPARVFGSVDSISHHDYYGDSENGGADGGAPPVEFQSSTAQAHSFMHPGPGSGSSQRGSDWELC